MLFFEHLLSSLDMRKLKKSGVFQGKAVFNVKIGAQTFLSSNMAFHIAMLAFCAFH